MISLNMKILFMILKLIPEFISASQSKVGKPKLTKIEDTPKCEKGHSWNLTVLFNSSHKYSA